MTSTVDGRVTKLRASCDACNEAKVRCSQTKPTCARCEKNDTNCVYGLSRRSHKNAPRIGTSQGSAYTHCPSPSGHTRTMSISENTTSSNTSSSSSPPSRLRSQPDSPLPLPAAISPPSAPGTSHSNIMLGTAQMNTTTQLPTLFPDDHLFSEFGLALDGTGADVFGQDYDMLDFPPSSSPQNNPMGDSIMGGELLEYALPLQQQLEQQHRPPPQPPTNTNSPCSCASRLMTELAAMPPGSAASCDRFDAQLSQLRRVINIAEDCITCPCTTQDDMSIMTTSILIGRVIQGLEASLMRTTTSPYSSYSSYSSSAPASSTSSSSAPDTAPKLSLGELQIDPEEENQLKQHLWLLQFRKLRKVISKMSVSVRLLTGTGNIGATGGGAGMGGNAGGGMVHSHVAGAKGGWAQGAV
ncbi:Putative Zn2/Cys6 DNA-binding protein [Aspergillus calidoustus]|uniref:Putative Zn2/Cys6 DNA-binding protein n=1 Tax=Aspergillus calidoustus TaxID=454130 RepID=A0A0U5GN16_ASPCI|nr:Putative Zn2/Cys6 DNA-binding protein [Aspergillus calidoustus]